MLRSLTAVVLGLGLSGVARGGAPADPFSYAVFGIADVTLAGVTVVVGDVGVNQGTVSVGPRARVGGTLAADTITLKHHVRLDVLRCNVLHTQGSEVCDPITLPLVPPGSVPADRMR